MSAIRSFFWAKEWIAPIALLSWATWANRSWLLFCHEWPEQIAHGRSFVKSDERELLKSLFKKEWKSKGGKNCHRKNIRMLQIFWVNNSFFESNFLESQWITHIAFFLRAMRAILLHSSFVKSDSLTSLFCKERLSKSLTFALL